MERMPAFMVEQFSEAYGGRKPSFYFLSYLQEYLIAREHANVMSNISWALEWFVRGKDRRHERVYVLYFSLVWSLLTIRDFISVVNARLVPVKPPPVMASRFEDDACPPLESRPYLAHLYGAPDELRQIFLDRYCATSIPVADGVFHLAPEHTSYDFDGEEIDWSGEIAGTIIDRYRAEPNVFKRVGICAKDLDMLIFDECTFPCSPRNLARIRGFIVSRLSYMRGYGGGRQTWWTKIAIELKQNPIGCMLAHRELCILNPKLRPLLGVEDKPSALIRLSSVLCD
jgi:hypothetical protein